MSVMLFDRIVCNLEWRPELRFYSEFMSRKFHNFRYLEGVSFLTSALLSFDLRVGHLILHSLGLKIFTGDICGPSGDKNFF